MKKKLNFSSLKGATATLKDRKFIPLAVVHVEDCTYYFISLSVRAAVHIQRQMIQFYD